MSQAPAWVLSLRKSNRVLKDNDHVYASLEVIKAQYNRYDQDGKIRLPHFRRFNEEQTNTYWADIFSSDEDTDMFISEVKRKYQPEGLDATIDRLRFYQQDDFKGWRNISEIKRLTTGENRIKGPRITARVTKVVNELLPFLEGKKKTGKQAGATASGLARINVEMRDVTKEKIDSVLQENFDTWNEDQQKRYLSNLNRLLFKDMNKVTQLKPFFTQKYGKKMIPLLNQWGWNREFRVVVTDAQEDLTDLGFKRQGKYQIIESFTGDRKELLREVVEASNKRPKFRAKPIYQLFGQLDLVEYSKDDTKGMIFTKYEIVEPFNSKKAQYYLEKVMSSGEFKKLSTKKLDAIKQRSDFIHRSLLKILDGKYESMIEDGTMADNFILSMQTMKFANDKYRLNYYARTVYDASLKGDTNSEFYSSALENRLREVDNPSFEKYKKDIVNQLKSRGSLRDAYEASKKQLEQNLQMIRKSLTESQFELVDDLVEGEEEAEELLNEIPMNEDEQSNNQKEIMSLIGDLSQKDDLGIRSKKIRYGDKKSVTAYVVASKSIYDKITKLLFLLDLEPAGSVLKNTVDELKDSFDTQFQELDEALETNYGKVFEVEFDESKFSEGHEEDIAEIAYKGLAAGKDLDSVLSGEVIKGKIETLDNLYNVIVGAGRIYLSEDKEKLTSLVEKVKPSEDLNILESPFAKEIKDIAKIIKEMIPKLRQEITQDIKDKIEEIISESLTYQKKRAKSSKRNFLKTLENQNIIRAVENDD